MAAHERGEWLEGRNPVWEALQAGRKLKKVILAKKAHGPQLDAIIAGVQERGIPLEYWDRRELDRLATTGRHQGVMALAEPLVTVTVDKLLAEARARGEEPLLLLLDGVEDPQNGRSSGR